MGQVGQNNDGGDDITCTNAGQWYDWNTGDVLCCNYSTGATTVTTQLTAPQITAVMAGNYWITMAVTGAGTDDGAVVGAGTAIDGTVHAAGIQHSYMAKARASFSLSVGFYHDLDANQTLGVKVKSDKAGDVISVYHIVLNAERKGPKLQ